MRLTLIGLCAFCPLLAAKAVAGNETLATFQAHERLGLDWPATLVTYRATFAPGKAYPGRLRLEDAAGVEVPVQLSMVELHEDGSVARARVSFMAALAREGNWTYRLVVGPPQRVESACKASHEKDYLTLENGVLAVRLPSPGHHDFDPPLSFASDHGEMTRIYGEQVQRQIAPGPVQGIRPADGSWIGGSYFGADDPQQAPRVLGYSCEVTERGPLFVEARIRYKFDEERFYQFTIRLLDGDPTARVDEQYDMRQTASAFKWQVVMSLTNGTSAQAWKPDRVFWYSATPAQAHIPGRDCELDARVRSLGVLPWSADNPCYGSGTLEYDQSDSKVFDVAVWYPWHKNAHYFGLLDDSTLAEEPARQGRVPMLGVIPMHAGNWRGASGSFNAQLFTCANGNAALHWPLCVEPHPNSLLHTGEYDPDLPYTFGRRQWGLVAGPLKYHAELHHFRQYEGFVNLDDYKDWILDWPDDPAVTYPRLLFSRRDLERAKARQSRQEDGNTFDKLLYIKPDEARAEHLWKQLSSGGPRGQTTAVLMGNGLDYLRWASSFGQTGMAAWALDMDELLPSSTTSDVQRRELRAQVAALCYLLSEPDFNPRGSMVHLGNPNMPINRFFALVFAAALIPDHPQAHEWLDVAGEYLRYKLAMNEGINGTWSELITYFHASCPFLMQAATILDQSGTLDDTTARLAAMPGRFALELLSPPDPRFGRRMQLGWGHEGYFVYPFWQAAPLVRDADPELARALAWGWDQLGRPVEAAHDLGFTERLLSIHELADGLPDDYVPPHLQSTWLPGFGAVLRAHAGSTDETCLQYRQGYLTSHCDANQGDFVLYSKGAPLTTFSLFGYSLHDVESVPSPFGKLDKTFGWHNRVRFRSQDNRGGWPGGGPISQVHAHFFSDSSDYLRGLGDYPPQCWTRQILFLKSKLAAGPNYFVFRDSFHRLEGTSRDLEPKWWYLRTLGDSKRVTSSEHELDYNSPFGAGLNVHFLTPQSVRVQQAQATHLGPLWYQAAVNWRNAGSPVVEDDWKGNRDGITVRETMTVSAVGPVAAGDDIFCVLYPYAPGEHLPRYELLGDGAARITTSEATDYVFLSRSGMEFAHGDVAFKGIAGSIRVFPDEIHLAIAEGPGEVSYRGTVLRSPVPIVKVLPSEQIGEPQRIEIPPAPNPVAFEIDAFARFEEIAPGVRRAHLSDGMAYVFDAETQFAYDHDGVSFSGTRGGILVNERAGTVKLVLEEGEQIGYRDVRAWGCRGPYEVTFREDRILGRAGGPGRFLYLTPPSGLKRLPVLIVDGRSYAPGTSGALIVPLLSGAHDFEVRPLDQPPIWRNWQAWPDNLQNGD